MSLEGMDLIRFGELRGYLRAFAKLNSALGSPDITFDFTFEPVVRRGDVLESLETYFHHSLAIPPQRHVVTINEAVPWQRAVEDAIARWFFQGPHGNPYARAGEKRLLRQDAEPVSAFIQMLEGFFIGRNVRAWRVSVDTSPDSYAVSYELVAFAVDEKVFLLDLQLND